MKFDFDKSRKKIKFDKIIPEIDIFTQQLEF